MSGYKPGDGGGYQWRALWCGGPQLDFKYATGLAVSVLSGNDRFLEARACLCADASLSVGKDWWENQAESGGRFVLTQDSGRLLKPLASNKSAEGIAGLCMVGPGTLDSGCVQGLVAPLGPWQGCCCAHPLLPGALGRPHSHITRLMPGE